MIQQLRNEAHRFGLTLHRNIRSKNALKSPLDEVEGIGPKTKEMLLKKSLNHLSELKAAREEEIIEMLGSVKGGKNFSKTAGTLIFYLFIRFIKWFYNQLLNFTLNMSMRKKLLILLVSGLGLFGFAQSITEDAPSEVKLPLGQGNGLNLESTMVFSMPAMLL